MKKSIETLKADLAKVRTGRAHTGLLDHITVDYYGTPTPLNQVANVTLVDARTIGVQPVGEEDGRRRSRRRSAIPTWASTRPPQGEMIRVPMPALTEERRKELIKVVQHEGENAHVAVRNLRRDANTPPEGAAQEARTSPRTTSAARRTRCRSSPTATIAEIDKLLQQKEADLMAV